MHLGLVLFVCMAVSTLAVDLPSCARAKCIHCGVDFIRKMCPAACGQCGTSADHRPPQPPSVFKAPVESVNTRYISSEGGAQSQTLNLQGPSNQFPNPVQFAAPTQQQQVPLAYPQQNTATLAPLIDVPRVAEVNRNLASQPADLAQPLPEYSHGALPQQQPQYFQQPQANLFQQPPAFQQQAQQPSGYGSQVNNLFGQPFTFPQAQPAPAQTPFVNPFQPFLQQTNSLDPLNMFNLNNNNLFAQPQQPFQYGQHQQSQQFQNGQVQPQQFQNGQVQPPQYQNGQVQHQGNYNPYPQQPQPQFPQYQQYQQVQQPQQPQLAQVNGGAQAAAQPQPQPLPQPQVARNIDTAPQKLEKYVDAGKGTPLIQPAPVAAAPQCPRQPGWQPCIAKETANSRFQSCCQRLGEGCAPLCNYDATLATMQLAVLTGRCPLAKVGDVMICASGYEDVSTCCEAYGVFEPGYEHCRPYCNPAAGLPSGGLLSEKYKCLVKLQHIQQCFFVSQKP